MKINILCVGTLKEKYLQEACSEYLKRLQKYAVVNVVEVKEEKLSSSITMSKKIDAESQRLAKLCEGQVFLLAIKGKQFSSEEFAGNIKKMSMRGETLTFIIGGSDGVAAELEKNADVLLSFSAFTFPHQLMRVILLEQIYRAVTINNNITYHK